MRELVFVQRHVAEQFILSRITQSGGWNKRYVPRQHIFAFYLQSIHHSLKIIRCICRC